MQQTDRRQGSADSAMGYLTTSQAAQRLGLSRYTVLRAARRGEIAVAQRTPGGRFRFDRAALDAYAQSRSAAAGGATSADVPEDVLRTAYDTIACGVVMRGADGGILHANEAAQQILGLSLREMQGRPLGVALGVTTREDGTPLPPDERPIMLAIRTRQPQRGSVVGI